MEEEYIIAIVWSFREKEVIFVKRNVKKRHRIELKKIHMVIGAVVIVLIATVFYTTKVKALDGLGCTLVDYPSGPVTRNLQGTSIIYGEGEFYCDSKNNVGTIVIERKKDNGTWEEILRSHTALLSRESTIMPIRTNEIRCNTSSVEKKYRTKLELISAYGLGSFHIFGPVSSFKLGCPSPWGTLPTLPTLPTR